MCFWNDNGHHFPRFKNWGANCINPSFHLFGRRGFPCWAWAALARGTRSSSLHPLKLPLYYKPAEVLFGGWVTEEHWLFGTLYPCWSREFHKSVIYLSHNCQKTVSCKNVSEKWHKTVRKLTEICQLQNSVRNMSDKIWKFVINVSEIIILSENYQWVFWKSVRKLSEILKMTDFWQIYGQVMNLSVQLNSSKLNIENWQRTKPWL